MTLLDNGGQIAQEQAAREAASWQAFLRDSGVTPPEAVASPPLACRWVPDPASPDRLISIWEDQGPVS